MKLTILGNNGPYPAKGSACSGYLIEKGDKKILLDCGSGVISNLQEHCKIEDINVIILSHLHHDHISDIHVLKYAIEGMKKRGKTVTETEIYLPDNPIEEYNKILSKNTFKAQIINEETKLVIDGMEISFLKTNHPVLCYAIKIKENDTDFVYTGDTAFLDSIVEFAKNAELFLCDSGLLSKDNPGENAPHLTALEAGAVAKKSKCKEASANSFLARR